MKMIISPFESFNWALDWFDVYARDNARTALWVVNEDGSEAKLSFADLAERFSFGEVRVSHEQNLVLADVRQSDLYEVWQIARSHRLATANVGLLTDMICCPGGDLCALANARSAPIAEAVQQKFDDLDYLYDIGDISLNLSGCMNSCGHHHVANIGILGVDKNDEEWYQITIGGQQGNAATIGKVIGPSFYAMEVPEVIGALIDVYLEQRTAGERFIDTLQRIGVEPFKARAYAGRDRRRTAKIENAEREVVNA